MKGESSKQTFQAMMSNVNHVYTLGIMEITLYLNLKDNKVKLKLILRPFA